MDARFSVLIFEKTLAVFSARLSAVLQCQICPTCTCALSLGVNKQKHRKQIEKT